MLDVGTDAVIPTGATDRQRDRIPARFPIARAVQEDPDMLPITPEARHPEMMARVSGPFRKICDAVERELWGGTPERAYHLVDELIRTKPMEPIDGRCTLSLRVALRAIGNLRAAGLPQTVRPGTTSTSSRPR